MKRHFDLISMRTIHVDREIRIFVLLSNPNISLILDPMSINILGGNVVIGDFAKLVVSRGNRFILS